MGRLVTPAYNKRSNFGAAYPAALFQRRHKRPGHQPAQFGIST